MDELSELQDPCSLAYVIPSTKTTATFCTTSAKSHTTTAGAPIPERQEPIVASVTSKSKLLPDFPNLETTSLQTNRRDTTHSPSPLKVRKTTRLTRLYPIESNTIQLGTQASHPAPTPTLASLTKTNERIANKTHEIRHRQTEKMLSRVAIRQASAAVQRRGFQTTRAQLSSPYHYPEGPSSNLPFNPKTKYFGLRYWGFMAVGFGAPFGIAGRFFFLFTAPFKVWGWKGIFCSGEGGSMARRGD